MKYRWGFLDADDNFSACEPKVDDSTALDFAREGNEIFYRGKLNGSLTFRFEFDAIIALGYNYEHRIVLQWYDAQNDEWKNVWMGRFALTDCEIDYDTKTITVTPSTLDRYTKILDNLDKDYNIVKLAPALQPVNILIRPCLQVYLFGSSKIYNYVGGNSWDSSCDAVLSTDDLATYKFEELRDCLWFTGTYKTGVYAGKKAIFYGRFLFLGSDVTIPMDGRVYNDDGTFTEEEGAFTLFIHHDIGHKWLFSITETDTADLAIACFYDDRSGIDNNESYTEGNIFEDTYLRWDRIFGRTICNTDLNDVTISGTTYSLYPIAASDMAGANLNYNKIMQKAFATIYPSIDTSLDPTSWPQDTFDRYFVKPQNTPTRIYFAASPDEWMDVAFWWYAGAQESEVEEKLTTARTIRDAYDYRQTIFRLLGKADVNPPLIISGCLGGSNDYVGTRTNLIITPRSNVISSYYDTPAQNAPISLAKIFSMLKQAFKAYWHIDGNGNLHIEHISYYDNGLNYTDSPQLLVDLESELHTNTKNNKVFGQNKVKFDKQDMPEQYTFGWADAVTRPFTGYPINCLDAYVQKGTKDEKVIGDFDSDVDFVLSSPNDVSKEGFFLFALPAIEGGGYSTTLKIDKVTITDEIGDTYEVTIQNGDAAFVKIHETWWRYSLPCENVNINNEDTTAKTTGRFKVQNVEFADTVMAEILKDIDNCNKVIRTQQGDGHIKTLSINLNSLVAKGDLLFNFVGRWYYLKGTALGASITIFVNGESTIIEVSNNKFTYRYKEPISTLTFGAADVVFVDFADCDNLDNLTSCDSMFDGCEELLAVDFGNKTFGAVTSANNMFRGCVALTTLICPDSSTWKADLDFSDCPDLTLESFYDLIKFLYYYNAGVHTITPNSTMWNALDSDIQDDLIAKATERGWTINIPAQYSVTGESTSSTVYATINGTAVEIPVTGGVWQYNYNAAITSISFENDSNLTKVDFSLSDGLAGLTTLADAFKNCSALTSVDFSNCDLSNVASATDTFAGCTSITELIVPAGTWKPDVDLSDTAMVYADMLSTIGMLYTYSTGTHTITFNSTTWDSLSVAQQQTIFDAAQLKYWTTNAVAVVHKIWGKSTNINGTETFQLKYIDDNSLVPDANFTTETVSVDANGDWLFEYMGKQIYDTQSAFWGNSTITEISADEDFNKCVSLGIVNGGAFGNTTALTSVSLPNAELLNCSNCQFVFYNSSALVSVSMPKAVLPICTSIFRMFQLCSSLQSVTMPLATLASVTNAVVFMQGCSSLNSLDLSSATFASATDATQMFFQCGIVNISLPSATFEKVTKTERMFASMSNVEEISLPLATFEKVTNTTFMFINDNKLERIIWPNLNFAELVSMSGVNMGIFMNCIALTDSAIAPLATQQLTKVNNIAHAFAQCRALTKIDLKTFDSSALTTARLMLTECNQLVELDLTNATFDKVTDTRQMFDSCTALTTIKTPTNSTAISTSATTANIPLNLRYSPLTYQSMLNLANWVADFTGYTAPTITYRAASWNALSSAEQNNIDTILSGKNWNRAIA